MSRLVLKGFAQEVDLNTKNEMKHFLVFLKIDGKELRIPVKHETIEALIADSYVEEPKAGEEFEERLARDLVKDEDGATEFGNEEEEETEEEEEPVQVLEPKDPGNSYHIDGVPDEGPTLEADINPL